MRPFLGLVAGLGPMLLASVGRPAVETTENLVFDGGMEQWRATGPADPWWTYLAVQWKAAELAHDEQARLLTPAITDQLYDTKVLKPETRDVHSGQKALRLKGQLYLRPSRLNAYQTRDGDVYQVRYWVKGQGQSSLYLHVYGEGCAEFLEIRGRPDKDRWSLIEERLQVVGRAPTTIFPRLWASEELLIDDVSVVRVLRPGERPLEPVPDDCQERIAFAWPTGGPIVLDGRLEEPAWRQAVAFSGFRPWGGDQSLLAPVQPRFRVLFEAASLYFGVEVPLADARQVLARLQGEPLKDASGQLRPKTDTFTSRESVELFVQAPGRSGYRQFVVSLDGYRFDGTGKYAEDWAWNGTWAWAVDVAEDRWMLEVRVPASDLGAEAVAPAEGWRLNVCCNREGGAWTWAAVGPDFHTPEAFGKLIAQDFPTWRAQEPPRLARRRAEIREAAGAEAPRYIARLEAIPAAATAPAGGGLEASDWQAVTRLYSQMDFIAQAYRCLQEEVRYRRFFQAVSSSPPASQP